MTFNQSILTSIIITSMLLQGCSKRTPSESVKSDIPAAMSVQVVNSEQQDWATSINVIGKLQISSIRSVSPVNSGQKILSIPVRNGDFVNKGQVIARLDVSYLKIELEKSKFLLQESLQNESNAKIEFDRQADAFNKGVASKQAYDNALSDYNVKKAKVFQQKSDISSIELKIKDSTIQSEVSGYVYDRQGAEGAVSQAGQELLKILDINEIEAVIDIPLSASNNVKKGSIVHINELSRNLEVSRIIPYVEDSQVVRVVSRVPFSVKDGVGFINKTITGTVTLPSYKGQVVPSTAIVDRDGFHYIAKVIDNKVRFVKVDADISKGKANIKQVETNIIKEGAGLLNEGDSVLVLNQ